MTPTPDRAWKLLEPEGAWIQRRFACDALGRDIGYQDKTACQWCMMGAVYRMYQDRGMEMRGKIALTLDVRSVGGWNDHPARTQAEVVALLKSLDI